MKFDIPPLLESIEAYVQTIFGRADTSKLLYHNYAHTSGVVSHAKEIATRSLLNEEQIFIILAAAWFHDTGHLHGEWQTHEEESVKAADFFLADKQLSDELRTSIYACIMATKMPVNPVNILEEIICDADTYHLGTSEFFVRNELVWDEMEARLGIQIIDRVSKSLYFLESHRFFTTYCQRTLQAGKEENIQKLRSLL